MTSEAKARAGRGPAPRSFRAWAAVAAIAAAVGVTACQASGRASTGSCAPESGPLTNQSARATFVKFAHAVGTGNQKCADELSSASLSFRQVSAVDGSWVKRNLELAGQRGSASSVLASLAARYRDLDGASYSYATYEHNSKRVPSEPEATVPAGGIRVVCHSGSATFYAAVVEERGHLVVDQLDGVAGLIG